MAFTITRGLGGAFYVTRGYQFSAAAAVQDIVRAMTIVDARRRQTIVDNQRAITTADNRRRTTIVG